MFRSVILLLSWSFLLACPAPKVDRSKPKRSNTNPTGMSNGKSPGVVHKGVWPKQLPARVLYVIRHSSTVYNRYSQIGGQIKYDPLDSLGFKERVGIFLMLRNEPIRAIYTSMQRRSQMTAAPLAAHLKLKIIKTQALNEFAGGISEGICYSLLGKKPSKEEAVACDESSDDPLVKRAEEFLIKENKRRRKVGIGYRWPGGGESILDVDKRLDHWLRTLDPRHKDQTVAFIGHSGTNRFLLAKLMGWKLLDALKVRQGHTQIWRIERKPSGKLELKMYINGAWRLCDEPPTLRKGLPCLRKYGRRRAKLKTPETEVKELDKTGMAPGPGEVTKPPKQGGGTPRGAKPGSAQPKGKVPAPMAAAPSTPRPVNPKLGKKPYK